MSKARNKRSHRDGAIRGTLWATQNKLRTSRLSPAKLTLAPKANGSAARGERSDLTLADRFLAYRNEAKHRMFHDRTVEHMQRALRGAHRFILDRSAAERVAHIVRTVPDLLAREHQFARAPYDITWIEWPSFHYWMELRKEDPEHYESLGSFGSIESADYEVGYLIDHGRINVISAGTGPHGTNAKPLLTPNQYLLHTEWDADAKNRFSHLVGISPKNVDSLLWGSSWNHLSPDEQARLTSLNTAEFLPLHPSIAGRFNEHGAMHSFLRGASGDLRTVIALLLVLNRPSITTYAHVGNRGRTIHRGKVLPLLSHTKVTISIDPVPILRLIGTPSGDSVARRRHEVRHHYKQDKAAREYAHIAGCVHEFRPADEEWNWDDTTPIDEIKHWVCTQCGGKRWWVRTYHRGDESLGHVHHDSYEVTAAGTENDEGTSDSD